MSLDECVKLSQLIVKKVQSWPPDQVTNTFITFSGLGAQFSNKIGGSNGREIGSAGSGSRSPIPIVNDSSIDPSIESNLVTLNGQLPNMITNCSSSTHALLSPTAELVKLNESDGLPSMPAGSPLSPDGNNNISLELELIAIVEKLTCQANFLHENAILFDYTGKQVNGYFSMLRVLQRFFEYVMYQMEKRKRKFQEFYEIGCLLSSILTSMQDYRHKYCQLNDKFELINSHPMDLGDMNDMLGLIKSSCRTSGIISKDSGRNGSSSGTVTSEVSSNDSEDEGDEEEDGCEFDSISTDMVKLSSDLATSIESMKHLDDECGFTLFDDDYAPELVESVKRTAAAVDSDKYREERNSVVPNEPKRLLQGVKQPNGSVPKFLQKISDYYSRNEVKKDHNDREYGKEIRKEEYEKNQPKYNMKRFNFRINSLQSPTSEEGSPKKSQPITQKYYKYFDNLTKRFEENFNFASKSCEAGNNGGQAPSNGCTSAPIVNGASNGKSVAAVCESLRKEAPNEQADLNVDDSEDGEQVETDEEKEQRRVKLDEYILSKFRDSNDSMHLITPPMLHFYEGFTLTLNCEKELALIYGRVGPFWYCKSAAQIVNLVRNLIVILTSPPSKSIASLCNTDYCGRVFAHRQVNATLDSLVHGLASLEVKAYNKRYFKYLYREHVIYGKTVYMPVNSKFVIQNYGNELKRLPDADETSLSIGESTEEVTLPNGKVIGEPIPEEEPIEGAKQADGDASTSKEDTNERSKAINTRTVRCRLINYSRSANEAELCSQSDRCLVFHVHGGGFVLSSPDSHELYLRDWAVKLKGIPILSVDYVLRKRFPSAPQDVLDVYLTLVDPRNQQMMIELLGFQPERIILVGDSAGANLTLSLLCCLNEIRRTNPDYADLRLPIAMLCIYGAFDIRAVMSPSKFISSIDPILHHGNIMAMIGTYAGIAQKIRKSLCKFFFDFLSVSNRIEFHYFWLVFRLEFRVANQKQTI
jgi:acetyl esterase/lipase